MSRILALDYGEKRIGIALSDETRTIATPHSFVATAEKEKLLELIGQNEVAKILVGLPKNLAGEETKSAQKVRRFAEWLEAKTKLPIEFIDERFSTREAAAQLREQRLKGQKARQFVDSQSAQIFLQAYLRKYKN